MEAVMAVEHPGVEVAGPLAPYACGFASELAARGYAVSSVITQMNLMAQLSRWLDNQGADAGGLSPAVVDRFRLGDAGHSQCSGVTARIKPASGLPAWPGRRRARGA
jgi:hypothetical protein